MKKVILLLLLVIVLFGCTVGVKKVPNEFFVTKVEFAVDSEVYRYRVSIQGKLNGNYVTLTLYTNKEYCVGDDVYIK